MAKPLEAALFCGWRIFGKPLAWLCLNQLKRDDRGLIHFASAAEIASLTAGTEASALAAIFSGIVIWYFFIPPYRSCPLSGQCC